MKRIVTVVGVLAVVLAGVFLAGGWDRTETVAVPAGCLVRFADRRPSREDARVLVCVPAAYSSEDGHIIGHYSTGGKRLGTADYRYTTVRLDGGTCFQQASLVRNGQPRSFEDSRRRYRRALCRKGNEYAIVHSRWPVTLSAFARQLKGYDDAWNLDMGTYSYGWYRDEDGVHTLGASTFWNRHKQTNWLVVERGR